jgi:hypothetical protein
MRFVPVLLALLLAAVAALPVSARPPAPPAVDVQEVAGVAPDGRSVTVQLLASCAERSRVVEAVVTVAQPGATASASFSLTCIGPFLRPVTVVVPVSAGTFSVGSAEIGATLAVERGKVQRAADTATATVEPRVHVELDESAALGAGGASVTIGVTVACPVGTTGVPSRVGVFQAQAGGTGGYLPVCDGSAHRFTVVVAATQGTYTAGIAQALTFADIVWDGRSFSGVDDDGALELVP